MKDGASFTGNRGENGGAICVTGGDVTISGGDMVNNAAQGTGNGVYLGDGVNITLDGSAATDGITDAFGLGGTSAIEVTGKLTHRVNVEFADPASQLGEDTAYVTSADNGGQDLKDHFRVTNPGYTFQPNADETNGALTLVKSSSVVAVVKHADGTYTNYTSVQDAVNNAVSGDTVLFATYTNEADPSLGTSEVVLNETLVIPEGKDVSFGSVNVVATADGQGNMDFSYEESAEVVVKRGDSLTEEMIRVEQGASLSLGGGSAIILDGGAVWENGAPSVTDDGTGTAGSAATGNTGLRAHAPVIVNRGTLSIAQGATIRNNDNNYITPGEGFGSENYGGGIRNEGAGELTMTGGAIEGCYSREGGAIMNVNKPGTEGYAESGPTVIISGGEIKNNASQMKGAAIQTIYGGATTTIEGGAIANNASLHDMGALSVEEGGRLTVSGGSVTAADGGNAVYVYNRYSEEDVAGAAEGEKPFIEGEGAAQLVISGAPAIGGSIHLDDPCDVAGKEGVTYAPVVDMKGYTGDGLTISVEQSRPWGKIAEGSLASAEVVGLPADIPAGEQGFVYEKDGSVFYGGYDVEIAADAAGGVTVTGSAAIPEGGKLTVTIGGTAYEMTVGADGAVTGNIPASELLYDADDLTDGKLDATVCVTANSTRRSA